MANLHLAHTQRQLRRTTIRRLPNPLKLLAGAAAIGYLGKRTADAAKDKPARKFQAAPATLTQLNARLDAKLRHV